MKKYFVQKKCNFCNSTQKSWKKLFDLNNDQSLFQCKKCNMIFNDRSRVDFETIYGIEYFNPKDKLKKQDIGGYYDYKNIKNNRMKIQKEYAFAIDFILNLLQKKRLTILDVGSGLGLFLEQFKNADAELYALEVSDTCISYMKKNSPYLSILKGDFLNMNIEKKFDVISMFEFIEHVISPLQVLQKAHKLLHKNGYLIITTPNIGNISFRILKRNWPAIHPLHHNFYFEKSTLCNYLAKIGFKIKRLEEKNILYFSYLHIRNRLSSVFPFLSPVLSQFKMFDSKLVPVFSGGSINLIAVKE